MMIRKTLGLFLLISLLGNFAQAGILFVKSSGVTFTGADGVTFTGADSLLNYQANGITFTGADGVTFTGADGVTFTGADGGTYTGTNGVTFTGADGVTFTGADGVTFTGADGVTFTGADGTQYRAASFRAIRPNGVTFTGADGIVLVGAEGYNQTGADGVTFTGADGVTFTGADGVTFTGADTIIGVRTDGSSFTVTNPNGVTFTGADGITLTGADGVTFTGADGVTFTGADTRMTTSEKTVGLQSLDPELAIALNQATDDSSINAIVVFNQYPTASDTAKLREIGILGGTLYRVLPMISISATRNQIAALSALPQVRSIYGNRTLNPNSDSYLSATQTSKIASDRDLQVKNAGMPVSGRGVTVAVLDTGVNAAHNDLAGKVVQNVRLSDTQSAPIGFVNPIPVENLINTDLASGHGTFVAGLIAASGVSSGGKYNGVAPGANILGLSAGDFNLSFVLAGFDYILERGAQYNVRVVNCSFSANTVYDLNDPVNIASKLLTERGVSVVFSAGNSGAGNGTLNPYASAPWVVGVGATDEKSRLAAFSSRGTFESASQKVSLVAPGVNVVSLRSAATQTGTLGIGLGADAQRLSPGEMPFYTTASGTSFSAPIVAGTIALMLETNPNLQASEIKDILQRSATPLPHHYSHEVGAGMLNAYAAVIESAFPWRRTGLFRSVLDTKVVGFSTSVVKNFGGTVAPNTPFVIDAAIPANTVQANAAINWGGITSLNDLGLKIYGANGALRGESNRLNLPGLTGRREKVAIKNPLAENWRVAVANSLGAGTTQNFVGAISATQIHFSDLKDVETLAAHDQKAVYDSIGSYLVSADGKKFRPFWTVSRNEFSEALVRSGRVAQFVAARQMFTDVSDLTTRAVVESVQSNASGKLIFDASAGSAFRPHDAATKLVAAIAFVKAADLESQTSTIALPNTVKDALSIPMQWRGHVAVALQKGFLSLDGDGKFNAGAGLTKLELSKALMVLTR